MSTSLNSILGSFKTPPREFSPVPTWWWSGEKVEASRLRWQMEQYAAGGVYNLIVLNLAAAGPMHGCDADDPPFFSEEWWTLFLGACADAKRLGMRLWFYDQIGFSGANFQGRLVSERPEWGAQALESVPLQPGQNPAEVVPPRGRLLRVFPHRVVYTVDRGFDYFNPEACARLLDTVHGEIERRAKTLLGTVIAGSFQDELPNMPAWSAGFAAAFQQVTGYSILDRLPALWEEDAPEAAQVRLDYQRVRAALAEKAFFIPLFQWHERNGLICGCDQQSPARAAEPVGSLQKYADYTRTHRWYGAPGSDHDGHAKLHSSLAHLYGRPRVWLEAFHSTGWGGTLEETFDWLLPWIRSGITLYAPHADYYSTRGGWWEWASPSTCWRQPYWKHYPQFAATISRLCWLLSRGHHVCDLAVLYPTSTVQAGLLQNGPNAQAKAAHEAWMALTGTMIWARQKTGWLDHANRDYDALDEDSLLRAIVTDSKLVIGEESFSTLILPACTHLPPGAAERLSEFVLAGGHLIALHAFPDTLRPLFASGRATLVQTEAECLTALAHRPSSIVAPVPTLHRRIDDLNVVLVTATPSMATQVNPPPKEWFARRSYDFTPDRYAKTTDVLLRGVTAAPFLLDPFDGERKPVSWQKTENGILATVPFTTGPAQLLAWEEGKVVGTPADVPTPVKTFFELSNVWKTKLVPTMDNRHGDLSAPGPIPVQTWSFRHKVGEKEDTVIAGFGRYGWRKGPVALEKLADAPREAVVYSLTRGLFKDPVHIESLGPKGHVAEDFIHFGSTQPGQGVSFSTQVWMEKPTRTHLAIGSAGAKRAWINGAEIVEKTTGFLWLVPIELKAGGNTIAWQVAPEVPVNLRAYWALVNDPKAFARPEWMTAADAPRADTKVSFSTTWTTLGGTGNTSMQLGCSAPCRLLIDGMERGRQGGFDPYAIGLRMERYDLGQLAAGQHDITIEVFDVGRSIQTLVDARSPSGDVLMSGPGWWVARENGSPRAAPLHRIQFKEIGWSHLYRRPQPLPGSAWLEGPQPPTVVPPITPDAPDEQTAGAEWFYWKLPPGAVEMHIPAATALHVWVDGQPVTVEKDGTVKLDGHGREASACIENGRGRYGGGLLDGPVTYRVAEGRMELGDWLERGLECFSGGVTYAQTFTLPKRSDPCTLDLGRVRGTAEVRVNGQPAGTRFLSPYWFDISNQLQAGENHIEITVFNTLAPWLETHSPTRCIWAGTCSSGLFGPVRLIESNSTDAA